MNNQLALQVEYVMKTNEKDIYFNGNKRECERERNRERERQREGRDKREMECY